MKRCALSGVLNRRGFSVPTAGLRRKSTGFTLIELLTVIAIIGILAAIIIPVVSKVRQSAKKAQCSSNLRQTSTAWLMYFTDNKNKIQSVDPLTGKFQYQPGGINLGHSLYLGAPDKAAHGAVEVSPMTMGDEFTGKFTITTVKNKAYYNAVSYWHNVHVWNATKTTSNLYSEVSKSEPILGPFAPSRIPMLGVVTLTELIKSAGKPYLWDWAPERFETYGGSSATLAFFDGHVESISIDKLPARWSKGL